MSSRRTNSGLITILQGHFKGLDDPPYPRYSNANVSNPPTDAELDTIYGDAANAPHGFLGVVNDNGADTNVYLVMKIDGVWFYWAATVAV